MKKGWIEIDELTQYLQVPGGVVILREVAIDAESSSSISSSMVFVPCGAADFARAVGAD